MNALLIALLSAASLIDARLDFDNSYLYDMYDFKGTPYYPINECNITGCRAYLTYPVSDNPIYDVIDRALANYLILLEDGTSITFSELHNLTLDDGQKGYFEIPVGTEEFNVYNPNGNGEARPLALWLVKNEAPFLDTLEVYEAAEAGKINTRSPTRVTLMNVSPFTISASFDGDYSLTVKPSPFEMLSSADCEYVFKSDDSISASFTLPVNSPIISLLVETKATLSIETALVFSYDRKYTPSGYVSSPGYFGCGNRTFQFRNENYNDFDLSGFNETFYVEGNEPHHVSFYGDLNTEEPFPIRVYDLDMEDEPMKVFGTQNDNTSVWEYEMTTSRFSFFWDGSHWRNGSFMIRYEIDGAPVDPVTLAPPKTEAPPPPAKTTVKKPDPPTTKPTVPVEITTTFVPTTSPVEISTPSQTIPTTSAGPEVRTAFPLICLTLLAVFVNRQVLM